MDINLADLCAAVADAVPDRCALVCDGQRLTYRELTSRSEQAHPAVLDALVAGVPDQRFGERVAAVVELRAGSAAVDAETLREHCRAAVAGDKVPARIAFVPAIIRSPAGKADYRWARGVLAGSA